MLLDRALSFLLLTRAEFRVYSFANCSLAEMARKVDLERALEAQRVRLLRLLTGWLAVVALMSGGPLALPLPRWLRAFFADLLIRVEFAAQCMVQVSACLQAGQSGTVSSLRPMPVLRPAHSVDDVPSVVALLRRMKTLRRLLRDLPRHGRRLLRRCESRRVSRRTSWAGLSRGASGFAMPQWIVPEVERPPDVVGTIFVTLCSRSVRTGGVCVG